MTNNNKDSLRDLLIQKMQALYDVENNLVKALPKMAEAATNEELVAAFEEHLEETQGHVTRLEKAFNILDEEPTKLEGEAIQGLIADAEWGIKNIGGDAALDANLIAGAQYVEHYEIAGYGSACAWARELGQDEVADLLEDTLAEERMADQKLNDIATSQVNAAANEMEEAEADSESM
jgi:ferritin-like metal-binding protein YciE